MPASQHLEWLRLVDVSGPFLSPTVLDDRLTQGLLGVPTPLRQSLRRAHEEWRDAVDLGDRQLPAMHKAWITHVLRVGLDWSDRELVAGDDPAWRHLVEEHGVELHPDFALIGSDRAPLAFVHVIPPDGDPSKPPARDRWAANAIDRMVHLCRAKRVRVGLITDGERWVVVNAPIGSTSGWATWMARIWWQEPQTFQAFRTLLEVRRWFGPVDQALPGLLDASAEAHDEITTTLGEQVRQAVEAIIRALDRLNRDQGGRLLAGVSERQLYEAGLTVMMRMVVLLCAEERGLLPVEEPLYQESYAISTLRGQLEALPDEVLERRHSAWSRILALVRGVYGGIAHDRLRLPALGGSIFDPDRYPFLEGRTEDTLWQETPAAPLFIDDRVVLYLLRSLQILERRSGAQLLSFRALDVEQIGHVYEGLLEHTVLRMSEPALGLTGSPKIPTPCVPLAELEAARQLGVQTLIELISEKTGRQARTVANELAAEPDAVLRASVVRASSGDAELSRRAMPFAGLLRCDARGERLVYGKGSVLVTGGADRRETGSHYTPRHIAEQVVAKTLEPLCYAGPSDGCPREQWALRSPDQLLGLKVCDPAMGSGAFLVAVSRYLADRLVEAWHLAEEAGKRIADDGSVRDDLINADPLPVDADERMTRARRLVAERCLYGVDINRVAVELAKISIWLITWSRGRPFGFLDHRLKCGDSLLGITSLDQLVQLRLDPVANHQPTIFTKAIVDSADEAMRLRLRMSSRDIRCIADVEDINRLDLKSEQIIGMSKVIADAFLGAIFASSGAKRDAGDRLAAILLDSSAAAMGDRAAVERLIECSRADLHSDAPGGTRHTFHWPLQYPEAFTGGRKGFDAIIGNPPFQTAALSNNAISDQMKCYIRENCGSFGVGSFDLSQIFLWRAMHLTSSAFGMILPTSILSLGGSWQHEVEMAMPPSCMSFFGVTAFRTARIRTVAIVGCSSKSTRVPVEICSMDAEVMPGYRDLASRHANWYELALNDNASENAGDNVTLSDVCKISTGCTMSMSDAYALKDIIIDSSSGDGLKLLTTGGVDRYSCNWGKDDTRYLKSRFMFPRWPKSEDLPKSMVKSELGHRSPKVVLGGLTSVIEAFVDDRGEFGPSIQTWCIKPIDITARDDSKSLLYALCSVLNSAWFSWTYVTRYGGASMSGKQVSIKKKFLAEMPFPRPPKFGTRNAQDDENETSGPVSKWRILADGSRFLHKSADHPMRAAVDRKLHQIVAGIYGVTAENEVKCYEWWADRDRSSKADLLDMDSLMRILGDSRGGK